MNFTTSSNFTPTTESAGSSNPFFDMASKIGKVYADSMQVNGEHLWMSSARIIQEHTLSAMMSASQGCMEALTQNAAASQQNTLARIGSVNQKVLEIMTNAFTAAMAPVFFKPAN